MTPTEQGHSSLSVTSPIIKSPDVDDRLSTNYSDMYGHYSTPATTHMMMNKSYSPVPGVQDNSALYSSPTYNQYGPRTPHQSAILPSPQFIHSALGSPSPSVTSAYSNQHHQHYTSSSNYSLNSSQSQQPVTHPTLRTVYLGNIASDTQISDILDHVRIGNIEMARPFPEKNCLFLTFVDASAAAHFYYQVSNRPFSINGVELKIGWGKPSAMSSNIHLALQNGASRNVFLGSLDESVNEDVIREDLKRFGTIEHVRLIREKNIAFVHFLSIANAIKCVNSLPTEGDWQNRRVYYGKDRCCQVTGVNTNGGAGAGSAASLPSNSSTSTAPMYANTAAALSAYASLPQPLPPHYHHSHSMHHQPIHVQHTYQVRYSPSITYDPYTGATIETYTTASPSSITPNQQPLHQQQHQAGVLSAAQSPITATVTPPQRDQHHHLPSHPPQPAPSMVPALTPLHGGDMAMYHHHPHHPVGTDAGNHSLTGVANRTIYLGNIHPDTTCEEICNVVRGGILSQIRYMVDKHIAFIAFVDPVLALHFYTQASYHGIVIKSRRLKIGWGKPSSLPGNVIQAVQSGGSRNVYLGNMDDSMTEEKLLQDFSEYGDIELVNTLKEKNCAFVNFTSIAAAMRAIEGIRTKEEYKRFRINYGKDRCGNPPRSLQQQQQPQQQQQQAATIGSGTTAEIVDVTPPPPPPPITIAPTELVNGISSSGNHATHVLHPPSTTDQQDLLVLNSSTSTSNIEVVGDSSSSSSLVDLMTTTPASTLRLPTSDVDDQANSNGVMNTVLHH